MLRHCSTATATEYLMLLLRQDAVFVMIMEHEERHRDNQPLNGMNFNFVQFKKKYCCLYVAVRNSSSSINCFSRKATKAPKYAIGPPVVRRGNGASVAELCSLYASAEEKLSFCEVG